MQQDGDLFAMELLYNNVEGDLNNTARYNGNISAIKWQTAQPTGVTTPVTTGLKAYCYTYDNLNRMLNSKYFEVLNGSWVNNNKYGEQISNFHTGQAYDLNGNIQGIKRKGLLSPNNSPGYIDELLYFYQGNQLVGVDDKTTTNNGGDFVDNFNCYYYTQEPEYGYDANGNLTLDKNKGILNIAYNNLNLPSSIDKTGGYRIAYVYDAAGNKLQQLYYENGNLVKTTDFIGNFVYENDMPSCIVYDEGRVVYANNSRNYFGEVYLKDHLGNVRVACRRENGVLKTRQVDSYYPFGMNIKGLTSNSTDVNRPNKYLYNGKMMQDEMGLGWLDYGARFYDAVLGRWHSVDLLAEKYTHVSPYAYCADNPISFIDPNGKEIDPASQKEWDKQKGYVTSEKDRLQNKANNLTTKAEKKGWSSEKLAKKQGNLNERVSSLNASIDNFSVLEKSSQMYSLKPGASEIGGTSYNTGTGNIDISYGSTANFVHETTHAGQFESGDVAFSLNTGLGMVDLSDEVSAYKAQFAYSPSSVSGLSSSSTANSFSTITSSWVQGITTSSGAKPYLDHGLFPININSSRGDLMNAYPKKALQLIGLPNNFILKDDPSLIYKK